MAEAADGAPLAVGFARLLRAAGLEVSPGETIAYARALAATGLERRGPVYWAGRATLVRRPEDAALYDAAFRTFWLGEAPGVGERAAVAGVAVGFDVADTGDGACDAAPATDDAALAVRWSRAEVLRHRDFSAYTPAELDEARRLMADLRLAGALRRSRRRRPTRDRRGRPDVRRTVRRAFRTGGEPLPRSFTGPAPRPRRVVLLCDVSGSMEAYARALMRFVHAAVVGRQRVEAFALGTRLTRLTRELSSRDPDAALAAAAARVVDWSGGTRLGEGLRAFNDEWGVRGLARGAVVVVLSDGWDRGEPELVAEQMARLARVAFRIVWVNPLKASPSYAPLARGMAAALPYVDEFLEGHSLDALERVAEAIGRPRRAEGRAR